jgi:N-acetyl-anhydromuramyl-L-alanine amidase AmpD
MNIIKPNYKWNGTPNKTNKPVMIIIHHRAGNGDAMSIHNMHIKSNGWAGIGYHYYIRKDGSVYKGREDNWEGVHSSGENNKSIGICFEGNYETEAAMPTAQFNSGVELCKKLMNDNPNIKEIKRHKDVGSTACPGKNFPFDKMKTEAFKKPEPVKSGKLYKVQVGAFSVKTNAERLANELKSKGYSTYIVEE